MAEKIDTKRGTVVTVGYTRDGVGVVVVVVVVVVVIFRDKKTI